MKLIYLASPFNHASERVKQLRWSLITIIGSKLIEDGHHIYGPITESYAYERCGLGKTDWEYWKEHDLMILSKCDKLWVVKMKGWEKSVGVTAEIAYALAHEKTIKYLDVLDILPELGEAI